MYDCIFCVGEESVPINTELVPRVGDRIEIDEFLYGTVERVILKSSEQSQGVNNQEFRNRFWYYYIFLQDWRVESLPHPFT